MTMLFEDLWVGDRFMAHDSLWTKLDHRSARQHCKESIALGADGHGYMLDAVLTFGRRDAVEFVPPQADVPELQARVRELEAEVTVSDQLLAERNRLLREIPGCDAHGDQCVPHAIEWVRKMKDTEAASKDSQALLSASLCIYCGRGVIAGSECRTPAQAQACLMKGSNPTPTPITWDEHGQRVVPPNRTETGTGGG